MKILIIKLHALGDVIASTPFFKLINDYDDNFKVDHLVEKSCSDITANNPYVFNQVVTKFILSKNSYNFFYIIFNIFELIRLVLILRKKKNMKWYIFFIETIFSKFYVN